MARIKKFVSVTEQEKQDKIDELENQTEEKKKEMDELARDYIYALLWDDEDELDIIKEERDQIQQEIIILEQDLEEIENG